MNEFKIRTASVSDIETIRNLSHAIWPVVYKEMISSEQIGYMLQMMYSQDSLMRQMTDEACVFLIAEYNDAPIAFASYSLLNDTHYKLHKLYVLPEMHGKGYGKMLMSEITKRAIEAGGSSITLQVNKNNKAVHFYHALGFTVASELVLDIGGGFVMDDFIMLKQLV
jgi:ribosomal protein S18 acetylase RimI-like enzyme